MFDQAAIGLAYIESKTGRLIKVNNKFCEILGIEMGAATKTNKFKQELAR